MPPKKGKHGSKKTKPKSVSRSVKRKMGTPPLTRKNPRRSTRGELPVEDVITPVDDVVTPVEDVITKNMPEIPTLSDEALKSLSLRIVPDKIRGKPVVQSNSTTNLNESIVIEDSSAAAPESPVHQPLEIELQDMIPEQNSTPHPEVNRVESLSNNSSAALQNSHETLGEPTQGTQSFNAQSDQDPFRELGTCTAPLLRPNTQSITIDGNEYKAGRSWVMDIDPRIATFSKFLEHINSSSDDNGRMIVAEPSAPTFASEHNVTRDTKFRAHVNGSKATQRKSCRKQLGDRKYLQGGIWFWFCYLSFVSYHH